MPPVAQGHKATSHLGLACIEESRVVVCVCLQWDTNGKWVKAISTTMCACVFIYSSSTTGAKLTLCRLTHFPHCTSLLISNNSRSFGVGGGGVIATPNIQSTSRNTNNWPMITNWKWLEDNQPRGGGTNGRLDLKSDASSGGWHWLLWSTNTFTLHDWTWLCSSGLYHWSNSYLLSVIWFSTFWCHGVFIFFDF